RTRVGARGKTATTTAIAIDVIAPSGRMSGQATANATKILSARGDRCAGSASAQSAARRVAVAMSQANGAASIPLAAHHALPPHAGTIAAARIAAAGPVGGSEGR